MLPVYYVYVLNKDQKRRGFHGMFFTPQQIALHRFYKEDFDPHAGDLIEILKTSGGFLPGAQVIERLVWTDHNRRDVARSFRQRRE